MFIRQCIFHFLSISAIRPILQTLVPDILSRSSPMVCLVFSVYLPSVFLFNIMFSIMFRPYVSYMFEMITFLIKLVIT